MAGTQQQITVDYDDIQLQDALNRLLQLTRNTKPVMAEIAEYLHGQSREHFDKEQSPNGTPWAPLKDATKARKSDQGVPVDKILHGQTLHLRDTIFPFWSDDEAGVSTGPGTEAYAAAHQFGTEGMKIDVPAHQRLIDQAFGNRLPFPVWVNVGAYSFTGNLPARPYFGLGPEDEREVLGILEGEILGQL
ncbi:phage virion morphogenesis protein [Pontibacterium granulatum]|uniref:phage virion morphogenesis protein n=1 Tax=Pontibacterium granulatum TaxID=2036029 RepID=UPI00249C8704|nr:phage virion morphogenesis protein [Pontibacterium granulatum]MDI3326771.1 phage virion morphogenesis protein [Pontibacterium granulatum]